MLLPHFGTIKHLPLHQAAADGDSERMAYWLERGMKIDARTETGVTALHVAVQSGFLPIVSLLLTHGADANVRDHQGLTPLHIAASTGQAGIAANLLMHTKIDPNIRDESGRTPLHHSAAHGDTDVADILFTKQVDYSAADHLGRTPLHDAVAHNQLGMAEFLIRQGANIEIGDNFHRAPLMLATMQGYAELVILLLEHGADVNTHDHFGRTPLHEAAERNDVSMASALVQKGASLNVVDHLGRTPIMVAEKYNKPEMLTFFKKITASPVVHSPHVEAETATSDTVKAELKRLTAHTLQQARMFEEMLAAFPDQVYLFDRSGHITYANPSAAHMLGIPQADIIGKQWNELNLPPECSGPLVQQCMTVFSVGKAITGEISVPAKNGNRQYEYILSPLHGADGKIVTVACAARDITMRKRAEIALREVNEALELRVAKRTAELSLANARLEEELLRRRQVESDLRTSEERFRLLAEAAFEGIVLSEAGNIIDTNQQYAELHGYTVEELRGTSLFNYIAPEDREMVESRVAEGNDQPYICHIVRKDGAIRTIEVHAKMMTTSERPVRVTAVLEKHE